ARRDGCHGRGGGAGDRNLVRPRDRGGVRPGRDRVQRRVHRVHDLQLRSRTTHDVRVFLAYWGLVVAELPVVVVFAIAAVGVGLLALIEERIAISPVRGAHAHLVTTLGMATLLDGTTRLIWGDHVLRVPALGTNATWTVLDE